MQPKPQVTDRTALDAFTAKKVEIDEMLEGLHKLSEDHFGAEPERITRSDVGSLEHYAELLKRITDAAFNGGEHATT